jgi:hypothetical protein
VTRVVPKLLLVAALAALMAPAVASASPDQVRRDCTSPEGVLTRDYSNRDLRDALDQLTTEEEEYTNCRQVISAAIGDGGGSAGQNDAGGPGGVGGSGGGSGNTGALTGEELAAQQSDQQALAALAGDPSKDPITVGGRQVKPGENGIFDLASAENSVPGPLVAVLALLVALALVAGWYLLRRRVPALSRIALPTKWMSLPRGLGRPRFRR